MKQRGLLFVDRRSTEESLVAALAAEIGVPHAVNDRSIDERQASRVAIDARLAQIERIALTSGVAVAMGRSEEHTSELQSLMRISYAVFCLKKKKTQTQHTTP